MNYQGEGSSADRWQRLVANETLDAAQDARLDALEALSGGIDAATARAIAVEEVAREIFNPLPSINTNLNAGL